MSERQQPNNYVKYSGLGFQLIILTVGLVLAGIQLDKYFQTPSIFLIIAIFIAVFAVMYILIKKLK